MSRSLLARRRQIHPDKQDVQKYQNGKQTNKDWGGKKRVRAWIPVTRSLPTSHSPHNQIGQTGHSVWQGASRPESGQNVLRRRWVSIGRWRVVVKCHCFAHAHKKNYITTVLTFPYTFHSARH